MAQSRNHAPRRSRARSAARLAAVQALYQQDMETIATPQLLHEFHQHRFGETIDDVTMIDAEMDFFDDIVRGVSARAEEVDGKITARLAEGWKLERLDRAMRAILRAGTYELLARPDVTVGTVIDEYLDVAHAFFGEKDVKFVNGLLDKVAGDVRG